MCDEKISENVEKEYFEMNLNAAKNGLVESMRELARLYLNGVGVERNLDEAIKCFEKANGEGDESSDLALGKIYSDYSEYKNTEKAIFYLSKAMEKNNINALKKLAEIYKLQNDFEKMFECYQQGANLGNDVCMCEVAYCYFFGRGVPQDDLKALDWFIKILENYGCDFCNSDIVRMITKIYSKHFKFTDKKFLNFYITTEKLGHFNAMFGIAAQLYKTDKIRALKWYKMAADAGDFDAAVAVFYIRKNDLDGDDSDSCRDNYYSALEWYKKAVKFGNINAAKNLLMMESLEHWLSEYLPETESIICQLKKVLETEGGNKNV